MTDFPAIQALLEAIENDEASFTDGQFRAVCAEYEDAMSKLEHYEVALRECVETSGAAPADAALDVAERAVEAVTQLRADYDEVLEIAHRLAERPAKPSHREAEAVGRANLRAASEDNPASFNTSAAPSKGTSTAAGQPTSRSEA